MRTWQSITIAKMLSARCPCVTLGHELCTRVPWLKPQWNIGQAYFIKKDWPKLSHWEVITHYNDVVMSTIVSQFTSLTIVYSTVYPGADQRKHQSSASLAFVRGIHRGPVNSPHKGPVTRKMFPFDDVIMINDFVWNVIIYPCSKFIID